MNLRQENKRLARKTLAYSKEDDWLQWSVTLQMAVHNFTRAHHALRRINMKNIVGKVGKNMKRSHQ